MDRIDIQMETEDRYARLRLIPWWNQQKLKQAVVMVVGAGAIGNEIVKNLALLGVGTLLVVDMDQIENSNLSRSILYREADEGRSKAATAAIKAMEINPDVHAIPLVGSVITQVGTGFFRHVDVVLGGLDNREARLTINQKCWKTGTPWIDGAIEVFQGMARVFVPPHSACYECTMNEADYRQLNFRKSCSLLTRKEMLEGKVPTTPTTASVIAGIQVQEAVKLIHGSPSLFPLEGKGFVFNGLNHDSYTITYTRKEECLSHETWDPITETPYGINDLSLRESIKLIQEHLGPEAYLETDYEMAVQATCACGQVMPFHRPLITVAVEEAMCPICGVEGEMELTHRFTGEEAYADNTLAQLGFAPGDILKGRWNKETVYLEMTRDIHQVMKQDPKEELS